MKHIEEHILELYVLGSEKIADRRDEIAAHLKECNGCRHLTEQMAEFYRTAEAELKNIPDEERDSTSAVARVTRDIQRLYQPTAPAIPLKTPTRIERFGIFVRRHPVAGAMGGISFFGALAFLVNTAVQTLGTGSNPVMFFLNQKSGMIQVLDRDEQLLWERRVYDLQRANDATYREMMGQVKIADIDRDGSNEVVSTLRLLEDSEQSFMRVFRSDGILQWEKNLSRKFKYENREYTSILRAAKILVDDFDGEARKQIIVLASNIRSPSSIVRLDAAGKEIGRYWHFGHIQTVEMRDIDLDGLPEILAGASNDTKDRTMGEFPCFLILNPRKILNQGKSTACDEFQFPFSGAEIYYVQLPVPDIHQVLRKEPNRVEFGESDSLHLIVSSAPTDDSVSGFHYVFDNEMSVVEVKSNNTIARTHAKLKDEGKITSILDPAYLENLRRGVRYWNGNEWRNEVVKVKHGEVGKK